MWRRALYHLLGIPEPEAAARWRVVRNRYLFAFGTVGLAIGLAAAGWRFAAYVYLLFFLIGTLQPKPALAR